jgi:hypothetical protein
MIFYQAMDGNESYTIRYDRDTAIADLPVQVDDWQETGHGVLFSPSTGYCISVIRV